MVTNKEISNYRLGEKMLLDLFNGFNPKCKECPMVMSHNQPLPR